MWLLGELGDVPCEILERKFDPPTGTIYKQDTPAGKFPTLEVNGIAFFESGAILTFILDHFGRGRLRPAIGAPDYGPYLQWLHRAEATIGVPLALINILRWGSSSDHATLRAGAVARVLQSLAVLDRSLTGKQWLISDMLTGADIMCDYSVRMAQLFDIRMDAFPAVNNWSAHIEQRPAWQAAMAGDPPY
jgi:glutathione S-transferase